MLSLPEGHAAASCLLKALSLLMGHGPHQQILGWGGVRGAVRRQRESGQGRERQRATPHPVAKHGAFPLAIKLFEDGVRVVSVLGDVVCWQHRHAMGVVAPQAAGGPVGEMLGVACRHGASSASRQFGSRKASPTNLRTTSWTAARRATCWAMSGLTSSHGKGRSATLPTVLTWPQWPSITNWSSARPRRRPRSWLSSGPLRHACKWVEAGVPGRRSNASPSTERRLAGHTRQGLSGRPRDRSSQQQAPGLDALAQTSLSKLAAQGIWTRSWPCSSAGLVTCDRRRVG